MVVFLPEFFQNAFSNFINVTNVLNVPKFGTSVTFKTSFSINFMNRNPFCPSSGMYPPYFSGRKREIEVFEMKLKYLKNEISPPIIGEWAIGKTSLLRKFEDIANAKGIWSGTTSKDFQKKFPTIAIHSSL